MQIPGMHVLMDMPVAVGPPLVSSLRQFQDSVSTQHLQSPQHLVMGNAQSRAGLMAAEEESPLRMEGCQMEANGDQQADRRRVVLVRDGRGRQGISRSTAHGSGCHCRGYFTAR